MIYGTVDYILKDGKKASVEWAARAQMVQNESSAGWKMEFYQVYLVSVCQMGLGTYGCLVLMTCRIPLLCRMLNKEHIGVK